MQELISVIVPVYKAEKYLKKCVDSILGQTYENFELILVDDGSPDNSGAICDEYAKKDNRIKVIHKENGGVSAARNDGLDSAKGKYIMFVDSDDYTDSQMIKHHYNAMMKYNTDLTFSFYHKVINDIIVKTTKCNDDIEIMCTENVASILNEYYHNEVRAPWGKLYKKEFCGRFDESISFGEDTLFNIEYINRINSICLINMPLYYYNIGNQGSLCEKFRPDFFDIICNIYNDSMKIAYKYNMPRIDNIYYNTIEYAHRFMARYINENNLWGSSYEYVKKLFYSQELQTCARRLLSKQNFSFVINKWRKKDYTTCLCALLIRLGLVRTLYLLFKFKKVLKRK